MTKTQLLSITQYAKLRGKTRQAILSAIKNEHKMPGVLLHQKIGNNWLLSVSNNYIKSIQKSV